MNEPHVVVQSPEGNVHVIPDAVIEAIVAGDMKLMELEHYEPIMQKVLAEWFVGLREKALRENAVPAPEAKDPDLENRFTYHALKPGQAELYAKLRDTARRYAYLIKEAVPGGREQSLALTKLEEAVMWANAGIARARTDGGA